MVVKFFSNKKGGSSKAINYLLNEREQQGTARVLQGDPELTRQIINDIKFKQKTTVGCLSFEEKNISEEMKYQLMQDFENHLLPGMENRYNILWVEHTDKGRLELNFVIPKIDLESQKSLNPYYHKADLPRVEKWQDLQNLTHNFTNPKDPKKERNVEINSHIKKFNESYEQLNETIQELVQKGQLQNREQLIELLKNSGVEITRTGKDYISVKMPDSKKARKFKGGIYEQQFTSIGEIETISQRAEQRVKQYNSRDTQAEQQRLARELESYTQTKEREYRQKYPTARERTENKNREIEREPNRDTQEQINKHRENDREQTRKREQSQNHTNSNNNIHSNNSNNIDNSLLYDKQTVSGKRTDNILFLHDRTQQEREVNDSTRTTINERTPTRERPEYQTYLKSRKPRSELLAELKKTANSIREQSIADSEQLQNINNGNGKEFSHLFRAEQERIRELKGRTSTLIQNAKTNERELNKLTTIREFSERVKNIIVDTREWIKEKISLISGFYKKDFHYKSENLEDKFKKIEVNKMLGRETTVKDIKELENTYNKESLLDTIKQEKERTKQRENSRSHYNSR